MSVITVLVLNFKLFLMVLCRTAGLFLAAPLFSSTAVPRMVKVLACATLAVALLPAASAGLQSGTLPATWVGFAVVSAKELMVGLTMGFFATLAYTGLQVAGELLGEQMGFAMSRVADPTLEGEMGVVARLASVLGILLFVGVGGHHWLLGALSASFARVPVGAFELRGVTVAHVADGFARMYETGVVLAAPVLCVSLLTLVAVGVVARLVPQINALMLSFPLRVGLGLLTLGWALPFIVQAASQHFAQFARELIPLVRGL